MLVINPPRYRGRFDATARAIIQGTPPGKVGFVWVQRDPGERWECHACGRHNPLPTFEEGKPDAWMVCPCGRPFIVVDVTKYEGGPT